MAHIVLAWELGGGFGHLHRLRVLAAGLIAAGHRVTLIARNLQPARELFTGLPALCVQAPFINGAIPNERQQTPSYGCILHNAGYGHLPSLTGLLTAWHQLLQRLNPDVLVADHGPSALLVSRGMTMARISFGDGFTCPPPSTPLPLFVDPGCYTEVLQDEQQLVDNCNQVLDKLCLPRLKQLGDIYQVDETLLLTYPELDHFGARQQVHYYGPLLQPSAGVVPRWPEGDYPRVFAYLKESDNLQAQLRALSLSGASCIIYGVALPDSLLGLYQEQQRMRFYHQPVNIREVIEQADLVVSHGGHQLSAELLAAATPQLVWPLNLEQQLTAASLNRLGISPLATDYAESYAEPYTESLGHALSNLAAARRRGARLQQGLNRLDSEWQKKRLLNIINMWAERSPVYCT